ncbi:MAG TPA: TIR domain-containing protein [bacterium]
MARRVFFSFHYKPDCWRASQVRNAGVVEGNTPVSDNDWETVTKKGDAAIKKWIDEQMSGRSCAVVLIGTNTSGRPWVKYEIEKAWRDGKGVLGIYVHNLKNQGGDQCTKGSSPFWGLTVDGKSLYSLVPVYDPPYSTSTYVYDHIKDNLASWVENAITVRNDN